MPFVQDSTPVTEPAPTTAVIPTDAVAQPTAATSDSTSPALQQPTSVAPLTAPIAVPSTEVVDAKPAATADAKAGDTANAKSETKEESQAPRITITKSETVTTPLAPKAPSDAIWLFTWIPLVVMMGLWLYLRGRNQAAERARAEALLAASSKKSKKSSRSQDAEFRADDGSGSITQVAGDRIGKGNSKKNKKDKQQQKKRQAQSGAATAKANSAAASATAQSAVAKVADQPESKSKSAKNSSSTLAASAALATERKTVAPAAQPAKAIFEPLRKVTVSARKEDSASEFETEENDEQEFTPMRKRRPSPPPPVVTTPAKVSSGRFEKLNLPPANAGLGASSANRWPTEATRPVAPVRAPLPANLPPVHSATDEAAKSESQAPITARGLGAFVKLAKPNAGSESTAVDTDEVQSESSGT